MNTANIKKFVIGVIIRSDETLSALIDVKGEIVAKDILKTSDYPEVGGFLQELSIRIMKLIEIGGGHDQVRSVGISAPSGHFLSGSIVNSPNMPWKGVIPLAAMLQDQLGMAVALANNAYVTSLAEHSFGSARGMNDFIVVTLGSGMGSCIFSNGRVHQGYDGFAGEIGHTCVMTNGRQCGCGKKGCLEAYTSIKGVLKTAEEVLAESDEPSLMRTEDSLTIDKISELCDKGDKMAIEVYRRTGMMLGLGLANYSSMLNPEAFIITGPVVKAGKWLMDPMVATFEENVFHNTKGNVKFVLSEFNDMEHDVIGAGELAWQVKEYSLFK